MARTFTPEVKVALERVQQTQSEFWDALLELENITGIAFSSVHDYADVTTLAELRLCRE